MYAKLIIAVIFLISNLATGAIAQGTSSREGIRLPPEPIDQSVKLELNAIEVSDGIVGFDNKYAAETIFGYAFVGHTSGPLPGSFTLTMNCTPATFNPGESNTVTGGIWTLPVYSRPSLGMRDVYMGSLYGQVVNGKMVWDKQGGEVFMNFVVSGGTSTFEGVSGKGYFQGTLSEETKEGPAALTGVLTISYSSFIKN